jgi:two-component system, cell cycle sensor histidine kinase and response regulator CckA
MRTPNDAMPAPGRKPGRRRVLLVEDDSAVRSLARRLLEAEGHTVIDAPTGQEGLARWQEAMSSGDTIDVVVTDIVMPDMGGRELVTRLRASNPRLPVVYVSSYFADAVAGLDLSEPVELLEKPFTPASLAAAVYTVLGLGDEP